MSLLLLTLAPSARAQEPLLTLDKEANPNTVTTGQSVTFTTTATNTSTDIFLINPMITDTLPNGERFVSATPSVGTCTESAGTVTCDLFPPELGPGEQVTVAIIVVPITPGTLTNTVTGNFDAAPASATFTVLPTPTSHHHPHRHHHYKHKRQHKGGGGIVNAVSQLG